MKTTLLLLGIVGLIAGLVVAGQGAEIIPGFRSNAPGSSADLILYGVVIAGIGLVLIGMSTRRN
jgi:hypothetical protein